MSAPGGEPAYRDRELPVEVRVADLLGRMTLPEKTAQLHVHDQVGSVPRPVKALKGFRRILLEPGLFDVMVGPSSERCDSITLEVVE